MKFSAKRLLLLTSIVLIITVGVSIYTTVSIFVWYSAKAPAKQEVTNIKLPSVSSGKFDKFYVYGTLSESQKAIYHAIYNALVNYTDSVHIEAPNVETLEYVYTCLMLDNPNLFYINGITATAFTSDHSQFYVVKGGYTMTKQERDNAKKLIDAKVLGFLNSIPADYDTYDRIKETYEFIINNTDYVPNSPHNQDYYSVFVLKESVCLGYSKAFQYLLYMQDIPCILVSGKAGEFNANHSWNMVEIEGDFYHVDPTWGDMQNYDSVCYDYLLIDDSTISKTHTIVSDIKYPECNSMSFNYYVHSGTYISGKDVSVLNDILSRIKTEPSLVLKFADESLYDYYIGYLIEDANLFKYMDGPVDYTLNMDLHTITIERKV